MSLVERLLGVDQLSTQYAPFAQLDRINPLLRRELHLTTLVQPNLTLDNYDDQFLRVTLAIYAISVCGCCLASLVNAFIAPIFILILPGILISIGVDMYANVRTVFRWHAASQLEAWDTLRLALRDDEELITTYEAIGNVRSWSAFRLDMTMRAIPAGITAVLGGGVLFSMFATLLAVIFDTRRRTEPAQVLALMVLGVFLLRMAILYVSDPMWRFRTNTIWSLLCAILFRDTATAITAAIGGSVGARMLHLGGLLALVEVSSTVLAGQTFFTTGFNYTLFIVWFAVLTIALLPITRWAYEWLYRWLTRRALYALRSGDA